MKRISSFDSIRNFAENEVDQGPLVQSFSCPGSTSPKRQTEMASNSKMLDDKDLFNEKMNSIISSLSKAKKLIVYHEEVTNPFSSQLHYKLKLTKYKDFFREYILVKPQKKKNQDVVKIVLSPQIKRIENPNQPSFSHLALAALVKCGIIHAIVSSSTTNQFQLANVSERKLSQIYGNRFRDVCEKCENTEYKTNIMENYEFITKICDQCGSRMKADFIKIGQEVSPRVLSAIEDKINGSDASLVIDSSLSDIPFAELPLLYSKNLFVCSPMEIPRKYSTQAVQFTHCYCYSEDLLISLLEHYKINI
jgi:NAD-dependent SIR2 family protein deacetylase